MGTCRFKALISASLPNLWDFVIRPENMHHWGPLAAPVTGIDRPLQVGDRVTQERQDFFRRYSQVVLVEEVIPQRLLRFRDLSAAGLRLDAKATITMEQADNPESTWIEEEISYSLGRSRSIQWLDRWMVNPLMQFAVSRKTRKAFRRLQAIFVEGPKFNCNPGRRPG
jgi:hypothetical protein